MIDIEQLNSFINKCKNSWKAHNITIIGSKDSIDKLLEFITNAKFEVVKENKLPQSNTIYIIPKREDKPLRVTLSKTTESIFKTIIGYRCGQKDFMKRYNKNDRD